MDLFQTSVAILVTAVGALLQGVTGLGLNLFASPILMMVHPRFIPGPILMGALLLTALMLLRDRSSIDFRGVGWMTAGMLPGTYLAGRLLPIISLNALSILLGCLVLAGVGLSFWGVKFPGYAWVLFLAGFISGVGTILASIGGPPVALVNQDLEPRKLRGTLSGYFILSGFVGLMLLIPAGRIGPTELGLSIWVLLGVVVGFLSSGFLLSKMDARITRIVLLILSALSALILIVQQIWR
ncbi:MAG TPA: sulfite exporter TauE/SafE family protein [Anaerolineaceae bacterium]|nr:sulfite exporter TauE/SafE family protein [Anaerolineaceae bacterium]